MKDIEESINSLSQTDIRFSIINYIQTISVSLFLVFILSFIFLSYFFDKTLEGIMLLIILGFFTFFINLSYKKNKSNAAKLIAALGLIVLITYSLYFEVLYASIIIVFSIIHSMTYFFKTKKKYSIESIFLTLFISLTFTFTITSLLFLIYAYGIFPLIGTVQSFIFSFVLFPVFVICIVSYLITSIKLLKKSTDEFNYFAYFKFKHFPFSLLNLLSSKDEDIKKTIIKSSAIVSILLLIISLTITAILGVVFVNNAYSYSILSLEKISAQMQNPHHRYERLIELKGFSKETTIYNLQEQDGEIYYLETELRSINTIFFNCDTNLNCQQKKFDPEQKIGDQVFLSGFDYFLTAKNETGKSIFLLPTESYEQIMSHDFFEFEDSELHNTQISTEINNQWQSYIGSISRKKILAPKNWQEKLVFFLQVKFMMILLNTLFFFQILDLI